MPELVNIPVSAYQELAKAPLRLAELEAAEMVRRGDVAGAIRHLSVAAEQSAAQRAQVAQQVAPPATVQPTTPAAPAAPIAPEPPAFVTNPRTMGEQVMARAWQANQERRTAEDAGAALTDLSRPMGLKPRR
jgi:hypothetical protein